MNPPGIWIVYLAGPPVPGTSAYRAARIRAELGGRLLGIGLGLRRIRQLDRLFPLCLTGWRLAKGPVSAECACYVLEAGQRLVLGRRRPAGAPGNAVEIGPRQDPEAQVGT